MNVAGHSRLDTEGGYIRMEIIMTENKLDMIADKLTNLGNYVDKLEVTLSNEIVQLLSEQLYRSPLKAIEELVVNAYDADATECRIFVPLPSDNANRFIVVFDNGIGMDYDGLVNLWQIGRSNKRTDEVSNRSQRKQIGKFGIGKLATYTITHRVTYISKSKSSTLAVTLNFKDFAKSVANSPVELSVQEIIDWNTFSNQTIFKTACSLIGINPGMLSTAKNKSWTFAILEDLKPKAQSIQQSRLKWVLSTAMPLQNNFLLFLNGEQIVRLMAALICMGVLVIKV